jgi:hypothetical protein
MLQVDDLIYKSVHATKNYRKLKIERADGLNKEEERIGFDT